MEEERKKLEGKLCGRRILRTENVPEDIERTAGGQEKKQDFEVLSFAELAERCREKVLMDLKDFSGNRKPRWSRRSKTEKQLSAATIGADDRSSGLVGDHDTFDGTWDLRRHFTCLPQQSDGGKRGRREFSVPEDQKGIGKCRLPGEESPLFYGNFRSELLWCLRGNGFFRLCVGRLHCGETVTGSISRRSGS